MRKRQFLHATVGSTVTALAAWPTGAAAQHAPTTARGSIVLTVSGEIGAGNRGAFDPALDQMMGKQKIAFDKAHVFDFAALASMPPTTIKPTLEYDSKVHTLKGPLLIDVLKACRATVTDGSALFLRAVDGYAANVTVAEARQRRFVVATHLDGLPMALGGLGPLWAVYEADRFADMAAKPVNERFGSCPWAMYHIEVKPS